MMDVRNRGLPDVKSGFGKDVDDAVRRSKTNLETRGLMEPCTSGRRVAVCTRIFVHLLEYAHPHQSSVCNQLKEPLRLPGPQIT